ncbi:aldo/keto reductase [Luteimonas sp. M1R5S18]|uniref:Aldo/keto reductase n=1 Tax=Luteimonas rhizosphaericola TaxID=3042024 RepID=A0ABT6JFZ8_9GAMM|nr:aldo/keto reductase [Luteimonas rhizosphaericola]MDH5829595.1 aldo/keto reductase [Luteimonas rhizosphaericola]
MTTRRDCLKFSLAAAVAAAFPHGRAFAADASPLLTRAIPSSGEALPLVGLGSSATFAQVARSEDVSALRDVLQALVAGGGSVFDTAPAYGASEEVAGTIARELGLTGRVFWATKLNAVPRGGEKADPAAAREQLETSFRRLGKERLDLVQVHNLADIGTQLPLLQQYKADGRIRYVGVTSTSKPAYPRLIEVMRNEEIDFIGVDYAVDNRDVEETILPLAQERRIGVLVYVPFGRTRLWSRIGDRPLPDWAAEFDAASWAQFMIKYVAAHPAVTCVTPATSKARNMADNLGGGRGRLPDADQRRRMAEFIDALPAAD